ncbi:hypothetical protein EIP91_008777 [Steccherinum ochraceum]|uniref:Uncharacterized protein n=1 Tax=Steccherinum ochraceum TaxID=92696 RepID=A0A4R0RAJ0_9APHY|nr:hypothetical protein EIP91_008777 [Steccherinum ochraceum]
MTIIRPHVIGTIGLSVPSDYFQAIRGSPFLFLPFLSQFFLSSPDWLEYDMASRLGRRALFQLSRSNLRVNAQNVGRRPMSSSTHGAQTSDRPWIIGSALIFGPAAVYLLSPPAKAKAHDAQQHSLPKKVTPPSTHIPATPDVPVTDDEGTEVPATEVQSSVQAAVEEDSPKDAQVAEQQGKGQSSESETAPATNVAPEASNKESTSHEPTVPTGAEPTTAKAEQKESPAGDHPGTLQGEEHRGAADEGEARERSKSGQDPKEAAKEQ